MKGAYGFNNGRDTGDASELGAIGRLTLKSTRDTVNCDYPMDILIRAFDDAGRRANAIFKGAVTNSETMASKNTLRYIGRVARVIKNVIDSPTVSNRLLEEGGG